TKQSTTAPRRSRKNTSSSCGATTWNSTNPISGIEDDDLSPHPSITAGYILAPPSGARESFFGLLPGIDAPGYVLSPPAGAQIAGGMRHRHQGLTPLATCCRPLRGLRSPWAGRIALPREPLMNENLQPATPIARVVLASFIGTSIEWYDFFLYGTAAALVFNR